MPNQIRPIHPGKILRDEMGELGLSARQLALALGVPMHRVTGIVNKTRTLTADTVLRLARYFGTSPEFWLNLQSTYELRRVQQEHGGTHCRGSSPMCSRQLVQLLPYVDTLTR
jgi:addiction module HigA family antidote